MLGVCALALAPLRRFPYLSLHHTTPCATQRATRLLPRPLAGAASPISPKHRRGTVVAHCETTVVASVVAGRCNAHSRQLSRRKHLAARWRAAVAAAAEDGGLTRIVVGMALRMLQHTCYQILLNPAHAFLVASSSS